MMKAKIWLSLLLLGFGVNLPLGAIEYTVGLSAKHVYFYTVPGTNSMLTLTLEEQHVQEDTLQVYQLFLLEDGEEEQVWELEIHDYGYKPSAEPNFEFCKTTLHNNTVWLFFWTDGSFHLQAQEKKEGIWNNVLTATLERQYDPTAEYEILVDDSTVGIGFTLKDGSIEHWELQDGKLIKREDPRQ